MKFSASENANVVNLIQALIGTISPNFRRVALRLEDSGDVRLWFLLERESAEDRDEIADAAFEFAALQQPHQKLEIDIVVDNRPLDQIELPGRVVYGRREV